MADAAAPAGAADARAPAATAPAQAPVRNAFTLLKQAPPKPTPQSGRRPTGCSWDPWKGAYTADETLRPSAAHVRSADQRSWVLPGDGAPAAKRPKKRAVFQPSWKEKLPSLTFARGLGIVAALGAAAFTCPVDDNCAGCVECGRMVCETCVTLGTRGKGVESRNPFCVGCRNFHVRAVTEHARVYQPGVGNRGVVAPTPRSGRADAAGPSRRRWAGRVATP